LGQGGAVLREEGPVGGQVGPGAGWTRPRDRFLELARAGDGRVVVEDQPEQRGAGAQRAGDHEVQGMVGNGRVGHWGVGLTVGGGGEPDPNGRPVGSMIDARTVSGSAVGAANILQGNRRSVVFVKAWGSGGYRMAPRPCL